MESASRFKRNYRACLNCRVRKVKCDLGPVDNPRDGKCLRCLRERKDCVFVESRRSSGGPAGSTSSSSGNVATGGNGGPFEGQVISTKLMASPSPQAAASPPVRSGPNVVAQNNSNIHKPQPLQDEKTPRQDEPGGHFSTMEGALVFLAKAAGTIAEADERDNIDAQKKLEQIESSYNNSESEREVSDNNNSGNLANTGVDSDNIKQGVINNSLSNILNPKSNLSSKSSSLNSSRENLSHSRSSGSHLKNASSYPHPQNMHKRRVMPLAEKPDMIRPKASNKLSHFDYIGAPNGILSEFEAENLINLFFTTMHPYFPFIPKYLHQPKVLAGYPILLCSILTIASRYHPLSDDSLNAGAVPRNIEVHDRLWLYVQRLISQTVWAEASTRSIGTVFAFLLFTEWNPRAIHWRWSDYANKPEDAGSSMKDNMGNTATSASSATDAFGTENGNEVETNLPGLGATRRSYRMAWMLIGSAVRLAQDMGFMEVSPKTFLATHIAEINSVMNISRRSMLAHSLSELDLDDDDDEVDEDEENENEEHDESFFEEVSNGKKKREQKENDDSDNDHVFINMNEKELHDYSMSCSALKFTPMQRAKIELLQIMSLGHESLYGYKAQLGSLSQRQNLSILNILSPILKNWGKKYKRFLVVTKPKSINLSTLQQYLLSPGSKVANELRIIIDRESLIFEYNYTKLYIYSLALSPSPQSEKKNGSKGVNGDNTSKKRNRVSLKLDEISKAAVFIEQAYTAANEMLHSVQRIHRFRMLKYMPVRWLTRIVRAIAFVVKCYLTITAHNRTSANNNATKVSIANSFDGYDSTVLSLSLISIEDIVVTIQKAAITLRDCSPDELHLCTRYSNILMYLCSDMKSKMKNNNGGAANEYPLPKRARYEEDKVEDTLQQQHDLLQYIPRNEQYFVDQTQPPQLGAFPLQGDQFYNPIQLGNSQNQRGSQYQQQAENQINLENSGDFQNKNGPEATMTNGVLTDNPPPTNRFTKPFQAERESREDVSPFQTMVGDSEVMEWFVNNRDVGLDFVGPWTEMIEQQLDANQFNFDEAMN